MNERPDWDRDDDGFNGLGAPFFQGDPDDEERHCDECGRTLKGCEVLCKTCCRLLCGECMDEHECEVWK